MSKTIEQQRVLVENVTEHMQCLLEIAEGKRPIDEWNQHAADLLSDVLKETEERDRIAKEEENQRCQRIIGRFGFEQDYLNSLDMRQKAEIINQLQIDIALTTPLEDPN